MKRVVVRAWTEPQRFEIEDVAPPEPGPGQLRLRMNTAAINFGDTLIAGGKYQVKPALPFAPGTEGSGVVDTVGPGVTAFKPGDRIAVTGFVGDSRRDTRIVGSLAEMAVVGEFNAARIPDNVSLETAALFRSNAETSYYGLEVGRLAPGETLMVLGASGGTGFAAVQLGKVMGARVIGSASSPEKRAIAKAAGADEVVDSRDPEWRQRVDALTGGRGLDVVYDPVGDTQTERAFRALGFGGRHVVIGFAAGAIPKLPVNLPLLKGASLVGSNLLRMMEAEPEHHKANQRQLMTWLSQGKLGVPPIARRYRLEDARAAMDEVATGKTAGRIVVTIAELE